MILIGFAVIIFLLFLVVYYYMVKPKNFIGGFHKVKIQQLKSVNNLDCLTVFDKSDEVHAERGGKDKNLESCSKLQEETPEQYLHYNEEDDFKKAEDELDLCKESSHDSVSQNILDVLEINQMGGKREDEKMALIKVPVLIGEGSIQKMVESAVTLEEIAIKVKEIRALVENLNTTVIQDKVIIQGTLHKQIFYVGEDAVVHHQTELIPISYFIDIDGALPGMNTTVTPVVEHVAFTLLDSTTLHQKVILSFSVIVTDVQNLEVETGEEETPLYYVSEIEGQNSQQLIVETTVTLNQPALKVDEITAVVQDILTDVITDKVIIQGILHKQIFYVGLDNIEYHQAEDIPFSLFVDVEGATPGMHVQVESTIETINYALENSNDLTQKVVIQFSVVVTQNTSLNIIEGTEEPILLVDEVVGETTGQTLLQDIITMDKPTQKIRDVDAEVTSITAQIIANKVIIQGIIHKQIYYIGTDDIEYEMGEDVEFSFFVDLPDAEPEMHAALVPTIESVITELLSETEMLEKVVLKVDVLVLSTVRLNIGAVPVP
ncbi:hypothetical protein TepRe1_0795 [Tepidanaerobacter acetatoxydans Re1]|nr:hypothetical protein TepRe1_0795 [Tepidanaerobacter acetatoxydans Re1]